MGGRRPPPNAAGRGAIAAGPARERLPALDALRGVALLGVLAANAPILAGATGRDPFADPPLPTARLDRVVEAATAVFVDGKFLTLFALLFGAGFALQLGRLEAAVGAAAARRVYRRRVAGLAALGALHGALLWEHDILLPYAAAALVLLAVHARARGRGGVLLAFGLALSLGPVALGALGAGAELAGDAAANAAANAAEAGADRAAMHAELDAYRAQEAAYREALADGGLAGTAWHRAGAWAGGVWDAVAGGLLGALGPFALGAWLAGRGALAPAAAARPAGARAAAVGIGVGLALAAGSLAVDAALVPSATAAEPWRALDSPWSTVSGVLHQAGALPLAAGYGALVLRLHATREAARRALAPFAAVGRMALTNYVAQSAAGLATFGAAWGGLAGGPLYGRVGDAAALAFAVALFAAQALVSRWWLARRAQGPLEALWRRATYGAARGAGPGAGYEAAPAAVRAEAPGHTAPGAVSNHRNDRCIAPLHRHCPAPRLSSSYAARRQAGREGE